jgi:hypothetical protein
MLDTPKPLAKMETLIEKWRDGKKKDEARKAVLALLEDPAYQNMGSTANENYILRNRPFVTGHKLKTFRENPFFAYLAYEKEIVIEEEKEAFVIGQAVDDLLTDKKVFENKYEIVARRGESEKIQLTNTQGRIVMAAGEEFQSRHFFPKKIEKHNIVFLLHDKIPCKMELDTIDFKRKAFGDIKTCASIETFDPQKWSYDFLMSFYQMGIKELYGEDFKGELYVLDKSSDGCRSDCYVFREETLAQFHAEIEALIKKYIQCQVSGVWPFTLDLNGSIEDRRKFFRSPYYSHELCKQFKEKMLPLQI